MQTEIYYRKVMNDLRRRIVNGDYARGEFIPSEERLQAEYGVSRTSRKYNKSRLYIYFWRSC